MSMNMMTTTTTQKLNLGQPIIPYPSITCIFVPSFVTIIHHQDRPSASFCPILRHTTHSPTLVRSHSDPFPQSNDQPDQVEDLRVPDHWLVPTMALQESEWLRFSLHKWLDDEYCPEDTNVEISRVAAQSYYNSLLHKQTDLGEILLNMARELESISYQESFHGAFSSANAAVNLIAQRIEQWSIGAVNTIIKRATDGKLIGYNTDCEASIPAIEDAIRDALRSKAFSHLFKVDYKHLSVY